MKGSSVPSLVAIFSVTIVFGLFVTGVVSGQTEDIFDGANQQAGSDWVEDRISPLVLDMCEQSGIQPARPPGNLTKFFSSLETISTTTNSYTEQNGYQPSETYYTTYIVLDYGQNQNKAFLEDVKSPSCDKIYYNGTKSSGSKISWRDSIDIDESNLKFRVFETGSNGNITIQVRQD